MTRPFSPELLEAVRGQLARELVLRAMVHDLRSGLTASLGWLELMSASSESVPGGLARSLEGLREVARLYGAHRWLPPADPRPLSSFTRPVLGIEVQPDLPLPLHPLPLVAALDLARPTALRARDEPSSFGPVRVLEVHGLGPEIVRFASGPHRDEVLRRSVDPDRALGAAMLREVVRPSAGEVRDGGGGVLELVLPGA